MVPGHQATLQQNSYGYGGTTTYPTGPISYRQPGQPGPSTPSTPYQRVTSPKVTPAARRTARPDRTPKSATGQAQQHTTSPLQEPNPNLPHRAIAHSAGQGHADQDKSPKRLTAGQFHANVNGNKRPPVTAGNRIIPVKDPKTKTIGFEVPPAIQSTPVEVTNAKSPITGHVAARRAALEKAAQISENHEQRRSRFQPPSHDHPHKTSPIYLSRTNGESSNAGRSASVLDQPAIPPEAYSPCTFDTPGDPRSHHTDSPDSPDPTDDDPVAGPSRRRPTKKSRYKSPEASTPHARQPKARPYNYDRAMREMPQKPPRFLRQRAREAELEEQKRAEEGTVVSSDGPSVTQSENVPDQLGSWQVGKEVGTGANGKSYSPWIAKSLPLWLWG